MNFVDDKRAVSEVLGAMLIFAMLITGLGVYQAFWVPSANAEVEIQHELDVNDQMVEVRGGVVEAAIGGTETSASVKLGAAYESRTFAVNPPNPVGSLTTGEIGEIIISNDLHEDVFADGDGDLANEVRPLIYTPEYNEHRDSGPIIYEHTAVYQSFGENHIERAAPRIVEPGTIDNEDEGATVTLVPVYGEIDERGVSVQSLELRPGFLNIERDVEEPEITLPYENQAYWEEVSEDIENELDISDEDSIIEFDVNGDGLMTIDLSNFDEQVDIIGAPVGINTDPPQGVRENEDSDGDDSDDNAGLNPGSVDGIELVTNCDGGYFGFRSDNEAAIDKFTVSVIQADTDGQHPGDPDTLNYQDNDHDIEVGADLEAQVLSPSWNLPGNGDASCATFDNGSWPPNGSGHSFFVISVEFDNGVFAQYILA